MADTMQFKLVSPERELASVQAAEVQIPGADGDMTVMPAHAATITSLRPGVLKVNGPEGEAKYLVTGGFAEISAEAASVLAEEAHAVEDVTQDMVDAWVAKAHEAHKAAHPDVVDAAAKLLADMVAMGGHIGLEPNMPS